MAGRTSARPGLWNRCLGICVVWGRAPHPPALVPEGAVEALLDRYGRYLTLERGLTLDGRVVMSASVRPFLNGRVSADGLDLERLSPADVMAFRQRSLSGSSAWSSEADGDGAALTVGVSAPGGHRRFAGCGGGARRLASWRLSGLPRPVRAGRCSVAVGCV